MRLFAWIAAFALLLTPIAAKADAIVTLCSTDVQPGPGVNLAAAIAAGGEIGFRCGAQATIGITRSHSLARDTVIDGEGKVTLDAGQRTVMFQTGNHNATFAGLTFRGGKPQPCPVCIPNFGGVIQSTGVLVIRDSRIQQSTAPIVATGQLRVQDTTFSDNTGPVIFGSNPTLSHVRIGSTQGIAIWTTGGAALIEDSDIYGGQASKFQSCTTLTIRGSRFTNNHALGDEGGGAVSSNCFTRIERTEFVNNQATNGGAVFFEQTVTRAEMSAVKFRGNQATKNGGAIAFAFNRDASRSLSIVHGTFETNKAVYGGAIDLGEAIENNVLLTGTAVTFKQNTASTNGGAISGMNSAVQLSRAIFADNVAGQSGGGIWLWKAGVRPTDLLANALFVRNKASAGSAFASSNSDVVNSTIASNQGRAITFVSPFPAPSRRITLKNTIVTQNSPDNCPPPNSVFGVEDRGNNIQYPDATCGASIVVSDPVLDTMFVPIIGSPALGGGDTPVCRASPIDARDVFGQRRPQGPNCTVGAIEGDIEHLINRKLARTRERSPAPQ